MVFNTARLHASPGSFDLIIYSGLLFALIYVQIANVEALIDVTDKRRVHGATPTILVLFETMPTIYLLSTLPSAPSIRKETLHSDIFYYHPGID